MRSKCSVHMSADRLPLIAQIGPSGPATVTYFAGREVCFGDDARSLPCDGISFVGFDYNAGDFMSQGNGRTTGVLSTFNMKVRSTDPGAVDLDNCKPGSRTRFWSLRQRQSANARSCFG